MKPEEVEQSLLIDKSIVSFIPKYSNLLDNNYSKLTVRTNLIEEENKSNLEIPNKNIREFKKTKNKDKYEIHIY